MNNTFSKIKKLIEDNQSLLAINEIEMILEKSLDNNIKPQNSDLSTLYLWKGQILNDIGENEKALNAANVSTYYKKTIENLLFLATLNNKERQHATALKHLKEAKKLGKNDLELFYELGDTYLALNDPQNASNAFMEALNFERDNQEIICSIAFSLYYSNRYKESLEWLFKLKFLTYDIATLAIDNYRALNDCNGIKSYMKNINDLDLICSLGAYLSEDSFFFEILEEIENKDLNFTAMIFLEKARILKQNQQESLVEEELNKALKIQPDNPKVIALAAYYSEKSDKISLYLEALKKGQTLEEDYKDWINVSLGELYYKTKEYQKAYQYSKEVVSLRYMGSACEQVVCSLLKLKKEDLIIEYACTLEFEFLLRLKNRVFSQEYLYIYEAILNKTFYQDLETDLKRQLELVRIAITKGDREKSIRTLSNIAILGNEFYKIKLELGNIYGSLKLYEEALKYLFDIKESKENMYWHYSMIIWNLSKLKKHKEALTYCYRLLEIQDYKSDPELLIETGYNLGELNRFEESLSYYYKAMRYSEPNFRLLNNIGHNLQQLAKYEEALNYYEDAVEYLNERPEFIADIYSEIGICLIMLDKIEEGKAALDTSMNAASNPEELIRIQNKVSMTLDRKKN